MQTDWEYKYKNLVSKVKKMREAQKAYFKSNKDFQILKQSKVLEAEVDSLIIDNPEQQGSLGFEFLAQ